MTLAAMILLAVVAAFWWEGMASKELARQAGLRACRNAAVQLLDDSVALDTLRLRRGVNGRLGLYRVYRFEFSSDGAYRYQGTVHMLGRQVLEVHMDPYRNSG